MSLPVVHLVRHGQTEWSVAGRHTGRTDLPLTAVGEADAGRLAERLRGLTALPAFTSPLQRAARTAALAGFGHAHADPDLMEWDYGEYEGLTTAFIRERRPDWALFRDGCPGGETGIAVAMRVDRVVTRLRELDGDAVVFAHGHLLRVLAARWLGLPPECGRLFALGTASVSRLGYDHNPGEPCIRLWNDAGHLTG
jgi:broad specificity phosphatase PhoE